MAQMAVRSDVEAWGSRTAAGIVGHAFEVRGEVLDKFGGQVDPNHLVFDMHGAAGRSYAWPFVEIDFDGVRRSTLQRVAATLGVAGDYTVPYGTVTTKDGPYYVQSEHAPKHKLPTGYRIRSVEDGLGWAQDKRREVAIGNVWDMVMATSVDNVVLHTGSPEALRVDTRTFNGYLDRAVELFGRLRTGRRGSSDLSWIGDGGFVRFADESKRSVAYGVRRSMILPRAGVQFCHGMPECSGSVAFGFDISSRPVWGLRVDLPMIRTDLTYWGRSLDHPVRRQPIGTEESVVLALEALGRLADARDPQETRGRARHTEPVGLSFKKLIEAVSVGLPQGR